MSDISELMIFAEHVAKSVMISSDDFPLVILQDITLKIKAGESVAILGASGSGKTTLLTLLAGLDVPTAGEITIADQCLNDLSEEARVAVRAKYIGFIFQAFYLLPAFTALENVMLPLELQGLPYKIARTRALEWLEKVGLSARQQHYPAQLSGGEQQRVAIARAFVHEPKIIFADEMTANLDAATGQMVADHLFALNQSRAVTLVLVTHDPDLAARCESQYLLHNGKLADARG